VNGTTRLLGTTPEAHIRRRWLIGAG